MNLTTFNVGRAGLPFIRGILVSFPILLLMLISPMTCQATNVVFIHSAGDQSPQQKELEVATNFYGLDLTVVTASPSADNVAALSGVVTRNKTIALVIAANALNQIDLRALLRALPTTSQGHLPLLILGLTSTAEPTQLKIWSGGAVAACKRLESPHSLHYAIGRVPDLTGQLTGLEIPAPRRGTFYFVRAESGNGLEVITVRNEEQSVPVFIEAKVNQHRIFLDCTIPPPVNEGVAKANEQNLVSAFADVAPVMLFIKHSAGELGWHALHHYANLTIDDPWLQEPYGLLDYHGLGADMERHHFHTTIAFIPWNYNRSEQEVVSLIRKHPGQFSISIHGDNHDHKEFTDYGSKSLDVQTAALRQSLARMDRFQTLTGIPYDKVMIFPHSIAPSETLLALKANNYLATINSENIPMGSARPPGLLFSMRPVTLLFGSFPSIIRYSVAAPDLHYSIAIDTFLDNPVFFYCHHDFFVHGMGAFDSAADQVNNLEPDTRWRGLGDIVRHYYLVKLRQDSNYDVLALAGTISLENSSGRNAIFYVRKMEANQPAVKSVVVDGQAWPFQLCDGYLTFHLPIPSGQARGVTVQYENSSPSGPVDVESKSIRSHFLRRMSDFRDNALYRSSVGRALVHAYYDGDGGPLHLVEWTVVSVLFCICVGWRIRIAIRRRHAG